MIRQLFGSVKKNITKNGFTLVEMLIAVSVVGVMGTILVSLLTNNSAIFSDQNTKITQGLELNTAVTHVEEAIKSATGVVSQYPPTGGATYTTGANTIVLSLPAINAQGLVIENTYDYLVIANDPGANKILRKKVYPNALSTRTTEDMVLSTKLSKLEFSYLDSSNSIVSPVQATKVGFIINVTDLVATESKTSSASGQLNIRNN